MIFVIVTPSVRKLPFLLHFPRLAWRYHEPTHSPDRQRPGTLGGPRKWGARRVLQARSRLGAGGDSDVLGGVVHRERMRSSQDQVSEGYRAGPLNGHAA